MRGRKPQPTALRVLRGNPGRRAYNEAEPQHAPFDASDVPPELTAAGAAAVAEWQRIAPGLAVRGHVTTVDRGVLVAYCVKYAQWVDIEAEARRHPLIVKGSANTPIANPAIGLANRTLDLVIRAAAELGITPTARARIVAVPPAPAVSKWAGALS